MEGIWVSIWFYSHCIYIFLKQHVQGLKFYIIEKTRAKNWSTFSKCYIIWRWCHSLISLKKTFFYTWPLGVTQKSKAHSSSTHVSAKKVLKFNYLSISEPFAVVDAIVCFFKSQIFQKRIFWVVDKKRSHGHSLLSGDTPGRLQVYWAEIQQLTMNPTASQHK